MSERAFLLHLTDERKSAPATHHQDVAALRFLYGITLEHGQRELNAGVSRAAGRVTCKHPFEEL